MALEVRSGRSKSYLRPEPLHRLTSAIAKARQPEEIYESALHCLSESLDVTRSSIVLFDPDGVMRFKAWRGLSDGYRRAVEGHTPWSPDAVDPQPVLVPDVLLEPSLSSFLPVIQHEGIRALAFIPLTIGDRLLGKFMLYYPAPHDFGADELAVSSTIATQVAFGLDQQEHRRHVEALRESEENLRDFFENAAVALHWVDGEGRIIGANQAELDLLGYAEGEYVGRHVADFHVDREAIDDILARLRRGEVVREYEARLRCKDGSIRHVLIDSSGLWREGEFVHSRCFTRDITARKHAEERRALYEAIFRNSFEGIAIIDPNGYYHEQNSAHARLTGYTDEDLQGQTPALHLGQETFERVVGELQAKGRFRADVVSRTSTGEEVDVDLSAFAVTDGQGRPLFYVGIKRDISERRRAEEERRRLTEELQRRVEELETLFDVVPIAIAVAHDPEASRITVNRAGARMLGISEGADASLSGPGGQDLPFRLYKDGIEVPPEQLPMQRAAREDVYLADLEYELVRGDGARLSLLEYASPLHDAEGKVRGALGIFVDVTESRRAAEAALRLAAIVESSDDAVISKDLDGIIQSWNPGAERLFGYTAEETIGKSIRMLIPEERQEEEDRILARIRAGERVEPYETVRLRKDGTLVPISDAISPLRDHSGRIIGASKIARDISAQKAAEEAIRQSAALKDQFLSLISHELRTPLSTIYGGSRLLSERYERISDADRRLLLEDIVSETARLQRIIENLLLMTKLDAGQLELEPVPLASVAQRTITSLRERNRGREISLRREGDVPPVMGNATYVELVMENLVSNAIKYSRGDQPVEVVVTGSEEPGVRVLDRGIGITLEDRERIFTPFFRSEAARAWASGVGVGLAVCKRVIEAQGGRIWVQPREGGGAEFGFSLRAIPDPEPPEK
ncbi:MAG TPA: PAS domain S-box protein [Dehalococcoidia bacterium]|nr:PAS domain S-box protein [Dehalococcoidia bacterium]